MILAGNPVADGGVSLGFEPLVFDGSTPPCSWLCNHLEVSVHRDLGIVPNRHGLIGTYDEARRCTDCISRDDVGAEPGLWLPWLVVDRSACVAVSR